MIGIEAGGAEAAFAGGQRRNGRSDNGSDPGLPGGPDWL